MKLRESSALLCCSLPRKQNILGVEGKLPDPLCQRSERMAASPQFPPPAPFSPDQVSRPFPLSSFTLVPISHPPQPGISGSRSPTPPRAS